MVQRYPIKQPKLHGLQPGSLRFTGWLLLAVVGFCFLLSLPAGAQVPALLNYQGRISVGEAAFDGTGQFKLALVNNGATQVHWLNAADANDDGEPDLAVPVPVTKGLYSLLLGDTSLPNMAALPASAFSNSEVYLRVWFNDGVNGFQLLSPDQRIASVGYAMVSGNVPDGAITTPKLASDLAATITSLTGQLAALTARLEQVENTTGGASLLVSTEAQDAGLIAQGFQVFSSTTAAPWLAGAEAGIPAARIGHTAIWSGQELVVWGGYLGNEIYANSGGRYDPGQDLWTTATTFGAPSARQSHSAIWTGTEMIVWGGFGASSYFNSGGRYQPAVQLWNAMTASGAPAARSDHASVWTGSRMIVWGGRNATGYLADGGLYDPTDDQWTALTLSGAPAARHSAVAVWTGDRFLVWGGEAAFGPVNSGGRLLADADGTTQTWETISTSGAPSARTGHSAVWTGAKMIIWGGRNGDSFFGDGALYDPAADTWTALPTAGAPSARAGHAALWTGAEMLVQGGADASGAFSSGGAYDPVANTWRALNTAGNPTARSGAKAVWSGTELIVFGGQANGQPLAALQRLNPQPAWYFYRKL
jgi:N-acetylneuraminic acid mutarotase